MSMMFWVNHFGLQKVTQISRLDQLFNEQLSYNFVTLTKMRVSSFFGGKLKTKRPREGVGASGF
jgi:hypothetical protein